jgi:hypothetical protein
MLIPSRIETEGRFTIEFDTIITSPKKELPGELIFCVDVFIDN